MSTDQVDATAPAAAAAVAAAPAGDATASAIAASSGVDVKDPSETVLLKGADDTDSDDQVELKQKGGDASAALLGDDDGDVSSSQLPAQFMQQFMSGELPELNKMLATAEASLVLLDLHPVRSKKPKKVEDAPAAPADSDDSDSDSEPAAAAAAARARAARARGRGRGARSSRGGRGKVAQLSKAKAAAAAAGNAGTRQDDVDLAVSSISNLRPEQHTTNITEFVERYESTMQWSFLVDTLDKIYARGSLYTRVAAVMYGLGVLEKKEGKIKEAEGHMVRAYTMLLTGNEKQTAQQLRTALEAALWQLLAEQERFEEAMPYFRSRVWAEFVIASAESTPAAHNFIRLPGPQLLAHIRSCVPASIKKLAEFVSVLIISSKLGLPATPAAAPAPSNNGASADSKAAKKSKGKGDTKTPAGANTQEDREVFCGFCRAVEQGSGIKFLCCGGCKQVYYCSALCQKTHWKKANHKAECPQMAQAAAKQSRKDAARAAVSAAASAAEPSAAAAAAAPSSDRPDGDMD